MHVVGYITHMLDLTKRSHQTSASTLEIRSHWHRSTIEDEGLESETLHCCQSVCCWILNIEPRVDDLAGFTLPIYLMCVRAVD